MYICIYIYIYIHIYVHIFFSHTHQHTRVGLATFSRSDVFSICRSTSTFDT